MAPGQYRYMRHTDGTSIIQFVALPRYLGHIELLIEKPFRDGPGHRPDENKPFPNNRERGAIANLASVYHSTNIQDYSVSPAGGPGGWGIHGASCPRRECCLRRRRSCQVWAHLPFLLLASWWVRATYANMHVVAARLGSNVYHNPTTLGLTRF